MQRSEGMWNKARAHASHYTQMKALPMSNESSAVFPMWRKALAASAALVTAGTFFCFGGSPPWALGVPVLMLVLAAGLSFREHLPSQVLVRAALWSNLILGALITVSSHSSEAATAYAMLMASATGLMSIGRFGLEQRSERFAPVAFRASLILTLVMALADTQSLALFGSIHLEETHFDKAAPLLACAGVMTVALVGLYRLAVWGLVLNLLTNLAVAGLALSGSLDLPNPIVVALCTTAIVQLLLPAPLLLAMVRGRSETPSARVQGLRSWVVPVTVALMVAAGSYSVLTGTRLLSM
jgi:hypothetical protein